jgi:hypothetical protein
MSTGTIIQVTLLGEVACQRRNHRKSSQSRGVFRLGHAIRLFGPKGPFLQLRQRPGFPRHFDASLKGWDNNRQRSDPSPSGWKSVGARLPRALPWAEESPPFRLKAIDIGALV